MIRTVIVDDDFLVRSYLKQLHAWERAGYQLVADARDGEEALDVLERLGPEVLITDISMPLMDGIELIRRVRERNRAVHIIVLSCHDDFEYVKEAMRLGADEYVLKNSLNEESLYKLLKNTEKTLKERKERFLEKDKEKRLMEMGRHSLKYYYFNGLLAGSFTREERERRKAEAGVKAEYKNSAVINLAVSAWDRLKSRYTQPELEQQTARFLRRLCRRLERQEETGDCTECIYLGEGIFCCFVDMSGIFRDSLMKQRLMAVATACFSFCKEEEYEFMVGVSSICFGEEGIRQAYTQAREMIKLGFYEEGILYYESSPETGKVLPEEAKELADNGKMYMEQYRCEKLEQDLQKVYKAFWREHTDSRLVRHWIKDLDERLGIERPREKYDEIVKAEELMEIFGDYKDHLFLRQQRPIPEHVSGAVRRVAEYLKLHYQESVGLPDAAELVGLNPAYLSYLFKQEMGCGFSAYLFELRMDCAKALLSGTNDKIKEVACRSGFNDYHYFSKSFKKVNGCSPAEYRKNHSKI